MKLKCKFCGDIRNENWIKGKLVCMECGNDKFWVIAQ